MPNLDLFGGQYSRVIGVGVDVVAAKAAEPRTCGTCGAATALIHAPGEYCAFSYRDINPSEKACERWYMRPDSGEA
jgi:hypothetical protein